MSGDLPREVRHILDSYEWDVRVTHGGDAVAVSSVPERSREAFLESIRGHMEERRDVVSVLYQTHPRLTAAKCCNLLRVFGYAVAEVTVWRDLKAIKYLAEEEEKWKDA